MLDDLYTFLGTTEGRVIVGSAFGIICATLAHRKGYRALPWFVAGAIFWVLALAVVLCKKVDQQGLNRQAIRNGEAVKCPHCAELIRPEAKVCRFCGHEAVNTAATVS